jgi:hypothetical protein
MIKNLSLIILAAILLPASASAQQGDPAVILKIRSILHDPVNQAADLYLPDQSGGIVKLQLMAANLSAEQSIRVTNGTLVLYDKAAVDPQKPKESVAASVKIPGNSKRGIIILTPAPAGQNPPYRMVYLDDSPVGFPKGESRVLSLVPVEIAIEAGEHKLSIGPGQIGNVPAVKKVNEFNMAQTNFYYKEGTSWVAFTERQLQYLDEFRRIVIVHVTPGSNQPCASTIVDTASSVAVAP